MRALVTAVSLVAVLSAALVGQTTVYTQLNQGIYEDSGLVAVDEVTVRARANGKGPRHTIWFASR